MTRVSRLDAIRLFTISALLILSATAAVPRRAPVAEELAKAYGLDSFD